MSAACRCMAGAHPAGMLTGMQVSMHADPVASAAGTDVLSRCIAVVNGKGGVGKTSLTANLAGLYAAAGYRTLAIDLDPQGNLGDDLGYLGAGLSDDGAGLVDALRARRAYRPLRNVRAGLDVLAGGAGPGGLNSALYCRQGTPPHLPGLR